MLASPTESRLLRIASRFRPDLETKSGPERAFGVFDVVGSLGGAPMVLVGLVWLIAVTDLALIRSEWPMLLLLLALLFVFGRLGFFLLAEVVPGTQYDWNGSLVTVVTWSAALMFGPSAFWVLLIWKVASRVRQWRRLPSAGDRWNLARNFTLQFSALVLSGLIALTLYERWVGDESSGGVYPLPGLGLESVLPALGATLVWSLLFGLVWAPPLIYFASAKALGAGLTGSSLRVLTRWVAGFVGWRLLVDPFAVMAAGLYAQNGLGGYLFFVAGLLLASFLAHQLSQTVERRQQHSRELEKLEQLGRAILRAPPDACTLPDLLREHVAGMFPDSQIDICTAPGQVLLHHPVDWPPIPASTWEWLCTTPEAHCFLPGAALPWEEGATSDAVAVAPILDVESTGPIGGIYLSCSRAHEAVASSLPAIQALASQIASALHRARAYAQTLAHQRVEQELALAGRIQASFLPGELPAMTGWQVTATLHPAKETAGDFYDVIPLPNGRLAIVMADVADKGVGAAMYMALSRTLIRTYATEYHARPDFVIKVTNRRILTDTDVSMFVTVFYGVLEPITGTLAYCNAGHSPPVLLNGRGRGAVQTLTRTGMALGVMEEETWGHGVVQIAPGAVLVLYTVGITEAQNAQGALFGEDRLIPVVRDALGRPARDVEGAVLSALREFVGCAPQSDDITLMVLVRE